MLADKKIAIQQFLVQFHTQAPYICGSSSCGCGNGGFFSFCRNFSGTQDIGARNTVKKAAVSTAQVILDFQLPFCNFSAHIVRTS